MQDLRERMSIEPMRSQDIPYERAKALPPCLELDMFMFANILEGPDDMLLPENLGRMPGLSRKYGDSQMLLLKAVHELGRITIDVDPNLFEVAVEKGFFVRKTPCIVWRVASDDFVGYGRNFEEALCKLLMVAKYEKD
jgi:hypothetical protein